MLKLRKLQPTDLFAMLRIENEPTLWEESTEHGPYSTEDMIAFLSQTTGQLDTDGQVRLLIFNNDAEEELLGAVDFVNYNPSRSQAEVSIGLLPPYRNQGIGQQALTQALTLASEEFHLARLSAHIRPTNTHSQKLFEKLGFIRKATTADSDCWYYLKEMTKK